MILQQDFEAITIERTRSWDKEVSYHRLRAQVPRNAPRWQRWMVQRVVMFSTWLAVR